ncbi:MAG: hypothetical protein KAT33_01940 [Bacteroidales bacterium]|jgi:hypothetical protein|nr:hypothetical protein [Bacteroidales bacterium]MCK4638159.1 hypothetical protein [Bacteroidales bacterium]
MHDIDWIELRGKRANIKSYIRRFLLFPPFWEDSNKEINLDLRWNNKAFSDSNINEISTRNGIYCFVVEPSYSNNSIFQTRYIFYIGKASSCSLRSRFKMYLNEKQGKGIGDQKPRIKVQEMLNDYEDHIYFYYAEIENKTHIKKCEDKLLNTFVPYVNTHIPEASINPELKDIYL